MFGFRVAFSRMQWGRTACVSCLHKYIYVGLCLNNAKHSFSAELDSDKKPKITGGALLCARA